MTAEMLPVKIMERVSRIQVPGPSVSVNKAGTEHSVNWVGMHTSVHTNSYVLLKFQIR